MNLHDLIRGISGDNVLAIVRFRVTSSGRGHILTRAPLNPDGTVPLAFRLTQWDTWYFRRYMRTACGARIRTNTRSAEVSRFYTWRATCTACSTVAHQFSEQNATTIDGNIVDSTYFGVQ